jgi:2-hydroxycyclohexanecarboxyl-CoA dehydrogenase
MNMFELNGKAIIVTGGGRGIGKGISTVLARQGARVAIADLLQEEAESTVAEIKAAGGEAMAIKTDVTDFDQVKAMVSAVIKAYGQVDVLVNNVGWDKMMPFIKSTPDFWDKIIAINYKGALNCCYAVLEDMVPRNAGKIINISSDAARVGSMGEAVYSGAKGAIISFSKTLAREVARNKINVNVVCPGPTITPLTEDMITESNFAKKVFGGMERIIPLGRMGIPEDIGHAVAFLAAEEASFITGQVLSVSGGLTMV